MPPPSIRFAQTAPPLPARPPHFVASSSASLVSSDLNWSYLAPSVQSRKGRRLVTGYGWLTLIGIVASAPGNRRTDLRSRWYGAWLTTASTRFLRRLHRQAQSEGRQDHREGIEV